LVAAVAIEIIEEVGVVTTLRFGMAQQIINVTAM